MTLALRGIVDVFRLVGRAQELHRSVLAFSVSHDHKTTVYRFTKNVYDVWMPKLFKMISSAVDQLPSEQVVRSGASGPDVPEATGLSRQLDDQSLVEVPESSTDPKAQQVTPGTSTQAGQPASKEKRGKV
ncbi:MAG: hypothetical protein Q9209_007612 [Squamulea sp. 1 TL-2023]